MSSWRSCSLTSVHHSSRLVAKVEQAGLDPQLALQRSSLTLETINERSTKVKITDEYLVYRNVIALLPGRNISIEIGLAARVSVYGLLGYAFLTAPTLRAALASAAEFPALIANGFNISLEESDGIARLNFSDYTGAVDLKSEYAELAIASFKRTCSDILGEELQLLSVGFEGKRSDEHGERCAQQLTCTVINEQPKNYLRFSAQYLDKALPLADPVSHLEILEMCRRQNREFAAEREWLFQVKAIIAETLHAPLPLEEIASRMHCSSRTLRRQLGVFKTSYRQLLDDVRFEKAKTMLKEEKLQTDQIAEKLGFCDGAGFRRAFQRWSGQAPGAYKA
ncbi:AraC family transcriptional regulator ligand-binding domain-containing protein [Pseudomonas mandelii]|uniref:AraC family transcriptional regulator n=1 Tax=Pseudomonas mandelii TaxID=75612 RepID=UPI003C7631EF